MKQLNVNLSEEDEANLDALIKAGKAHTRSAAVREALRIAVRICHREQQPDYHALAGILKSLPDNKARRFKSDRDLWE
jgi:Arc/MetJ-type ribon-helix-helix transcriptional regulator